MDDFDIKILGEKKTFGERIIFYHTRTWLLFNCYCHMYGGHETASAPSTMIGIWFELLGFG